ncbi:MAG: FecR domain-containing protein [Bacteroidetes bacterium]|nr:FecR domain-containing protein [Bacteroidota bacterium]
MAAISDHHQYLFLGKITNSLTVEEQRELDDLFARDPGAQGAYDELVGQLPGGRVAEGFGHLNSPDFWKDISGEIHGQQKVLSRRRLVRVAVVVAVVALGGWWLATRVNTGDKGSFDRAVVSGAGGVMLRLADGSKVDLATEKGNIRKGQLALDNNNKSLSYRALDESAVGNNTLDVPVGTDYKVTLSDGSEIWLNSASSLSFPTKFAAGRREIGIVGEAYCKIAKRASEPFVVHLGDNTVEVTGTEFNVNTYSPGVVKVALVDGGVNLVAGQSRVKVQPGSMAVAEGGKIGQGAFDAGRVLSWRQGVYIFEAADLKEISAVLGRWFGVRTVLDDPLLAQKRFTGALHRDKPLSAFLDNFRVISHIDMYVDGGNVLHFTKEK